MEEVGRIVVLAGWTAALQCKSYLCIPFLGIARPQSQFPHSCVCERFIYFQDQSTYFPAAGIYKSLTDTWMWKLGLRLHNSFSGSIFFKFSVLCLAICSGNHQGGRNLKQKLWRERSSLIYVFTQPLNSYSLMIYMYFPLLVRFHNFGWNAFKLAYKYTFHYRVKNAYLKF